MFSLHFEINVVSVPIDVQMEQWFLIVGHASQRGVNKFSGGCEPLPALQHKILNKKFTN